MAPSNVSVLYLLEPVGWQSEGQHPSKIDTRSNQKIHTWPRTFRGAMPFVPTTTGRAIMSNTTNSRPN